MISLLRSETIGGKLCTLVIGSDRRQLGKLRTKSGVFGRRVSGIAILRRQVGRVEPLWRRRLDAIAATADLLDAITSPFFSCQLTLLGHSPVLISAW